MRLYLMYLMYLHICRVSGLLLRILKPSALPLLSWASIICYILVFDLFLRFCFHFVIYNATRICLFLNLVFIYSTNRYNDSTEQLVLVEEELKYG